MSIESPLPSSVSASGKRRSNKFYLPLSNHGMPKTPTSPRGSIRPHRFSTIGSPFSGVATSPPMTPMSPMSPPMSAKSFGTFIDSEPSTPAYSPRMGAGWDSSTLMLLSPRSSAPSTPAEPEWEMMTPARKATAIPTKTKSPLPLSKEISAGTSLSSHPVTTIREEPMKENVPPADTDADADADAEEKKKTEENESAHAAPLEKLATRMKSILRRKTVSEKKSEKRRKQYQELDRMEDVHWTEM